MNDANEQITDVFHCAPIHGEEYILSLRKKVEKFIEGCVELLGGVTVDSLKERIGDHERIDEILTLSHTAKSILAGDAVASEIPPLLFMLTTNGEEPSYNCLVLDIGLRKDDDSYQTLRFDMTRAAMGCEMEPGLLFNALALMLGSHIEVAVDSAQPPSTEEKSDGSENSLLLNFAVVNYIYSMSDEERQSIDAEISKAKDVDLDAVVHALSNGQTVTENGEVNFRYDIAPADNEEEPPTMSLMFFRCGEVEPYYTLDVTNVFDSIPGDDLTEACD